MTGKDLPQPDYERYRLLEKWWTWEVVSLCTDKYFNPPDTPSQPLAARYLASNRDSVNYMFTGVPAGLDAEDYLEAELLDAIERGTLTKYGEKLGHFLVCADDALALVASVARKINARVSKWELETREAMVGVAAVRITPDGEDNLRITKKQAASRAVRTRVRVPTFLAATTKTNRLTNRDAAKIYVKEMDIAGCQISFTTAKTAVSRACRNGAIKSSGKGRARSIVKESLMTWILSVRNKSLDEDRLDNEIIQQRGKKCNVTRNM